MSEDSPNDAESTDDVNEDNDLNDSTTNTNVRAWWLGTIAALSIIGAALVFVGSAIYGFADLAILTGDWFVLLAAMVLSALAWTFGPELVKQFSPFRK